MPTDDTFSTSTHALFFYRATSIPRTGKFTNFSQSFLVNWWPLGTQYKLPISHISSLQKLCNCYWGLANMTGQTGLVDHQFVPSLTFNMTRLLFSCHQFDPCPNYCHIQSCLSHFCQILLYFIVKQSHLSSYLAIYLFSLHPVTAS